MNEIDKRIIQLIKLLKAEKEISSIKHFCIQLGILEQTVTKIKNGTAHFTVLQIQTICIKFNVNANWIFGIENKVFNTSNSIEITDIN